jgi:adenylosuccinate synthase
MTSTVVIGAQYGDEGKGKIVDLLADKADLVVRFNGGNNAGHTVVVQGKKYKFHLMPSGAIQGKKCMVAAGVSIDPKVLKKEMEQLGGKDISLVIDPRVQIIMPWHGALDMAKEEAKGKAKIGTTGRGIGPCYADRASRTGIRFCELVEEQRLKEKVEKQFGEKQALLQKVFGKEIGQSKEGILADYSSLGKEFSKYLGDVSKQVSEALNGGKNVLFEGAQGTFLDNDFGTYPFVTSSHPTAGAVFTGVGLGVRAFDRIIGIVKAYTTRVGAGPFVTELEGELADKIRTVGAEFGTTTGRPRRVGWLDLPLLRAAIRLNGFTEIALTKLDVLSGLEKVKVCTEYKCNGKRMKELPADLEELEKCKPVFEELPGFEVKGSEKEYTELPEKARAYVEFVEKALGVPIKIVSIGPGREETILRQA